MSSEQPNQKTAINLYGVYNQELARMHELLKVSANQHDAQQHYGGINRGYTGHSTHMTEMVFNRIMELQNILIAALKTHDPAIQEKVAELALTGNKDEIPF